MSDDPLWGRLSLADRLRLVAFEAGLAQFPPWMLAVIYEAAACLDDQEADVPDAGLSGGQPNFS